MKGLFLFLPFLLSLAACTSDTAPPPIASPVVIPTIAPPTALQRSVIDEEAMQTATVQFKKKYGSQYSHIAYSLCIDSAYYFIVVNGAWSLEAQQEPLADGATRPYQMGMVNAQNNTLIPIKFDKIYNMGATAQNLLEVEWQGKHGLYNHRGIALLKEKYDVIYPATKAENTWAYWRQGDLFGVLYGDGSNDTLEQQPNDLVQNWAFNAEATSIIPFINVQKLLEDKQAVQGNGILVFPSYLYDLNIAPAYEYDWAYGTKSMGMINTEATIQTLTTDNTTTLLTAFNQAFIQNRDYHEEQQSVVTVDQNYQPVDSILIQTLEFRPVCDVPAQIRLVGIDTIEVAQVQKTPGQYYSYQTKLRYYHLQQNGQFKLLTTQGQYAASQYAPLTEASFKGCFAHSLTNEEIEALEKEEYLSFEVSAHLSVEDVQYMRNEIYARHGYQFKSKKWQERFAQESWYKATEEDVEHLLSPLEKRNAQFLLNYQETLKAKEKELRAIQYEAGNYAG